MEQVSLGHELCLCNLSDYVNGNNTRNYRCKGRFTDAKKEDNLVTAYYYFCDPQRRPQFTKKTQDFQNGSEKITIDLEERPKWHLCIKKRTCWISHNA